MKKIVLAVLAVTLTAPVVAVGATSGRQPMLRPSDFVRNLSFQMGRLSPAATSLPPTVQLRETLQAQVRDEIPRRQALVTQHLLVRALTNSQALAEVQKNLRLIEVPENPALGQEAAENLEVLAAAAEQARWPAQLERYAGTLELIVAASYAGDDRALTRFFDGVTSIPDWAAAPVAVEVSPSGEADGSDFRSIYEDMVSEIKRGQRIGQLVLNKPRVPVGEAVARRSPGGPPPPNVIARYRKRVADQKWFYDTFNSRAFWKTLRPDSVLLLWNLMGDSLRAAQSDMKAIEAEYPSIAYYANGPIARAWAWLVDSALEIARYRGLVHQQNWLKDALNADVWPSNIRNYAHEDLRLARQGIEALKVKHPGIERYSPGAIARAWHRFRHPLPHR